MSAQDKTGAPSGAPTLDDAIDACDRLEFQFDGPDEVFSNSHNYGVVRKFLKSLAARAKSLDSSRPESDWYALEHAVQSDRFPTIDDNGELHVVSDHDLAEYVLQWRGLVENELAQCESIVAAVRELDVALNGVAAVYNENPLTRLEHLVRQVRSRQGVQVVNMADTMRINFQAPDGRRATLFLGPLLDAMDSNGQVDFEPGIAGVMRAAIAAYPCAGEPLPLAPVAADGYSTRDETPKSCTCAYDLGVSRLNRCPGCGAPK